MMYYRLTDGLNSVGKFIPETEDVYKHISRDRDFYLSIYKYSDEQKQKAEELVDAERADELTGEVVTYKRPRGVSGINDVQTNMLVFDFDHKTDLDKAKADTVTTINRLVEAGVDVNDINTSFSGGKGFSVVLMHDHQLNPVQHKLIASSVAGDLETFDTKVYNSSRIFRVNHTKHNNTGLYKTPLNADAIEELTIADIKAAAKVNYDFIPLKSTKLPTDLLKVEPKEVSKPSSSAAVHDINFSKKPYWLTDVKYALHQGYFPESYGNEGMMILCSTYKDGGFDKVDAFHMLQAVNEKRSKIYGIPERDSNRIWNEVVEFVYGPTWTGGTYLPKENDLLIQTCQDFDITDVSKLESFDSMIKNFYEFADNINDNVIKTGIKTLDDSLLITTGMMVGVLGAPSAGKTSLVTSIIEKSAKDGMKPLFHSLDMHKHLMSMRLIQRQSGISAEQKLRRSMVDDPSYDDGYSIKNDTEVTDAVTELSKIYNNVQFNFTRGADIKSIEQDIKSNKAKHGNKFKLVVVDYLEKVRGPYSDSTANSGFVASRLSDLASTYDVAVILLLQPQKSAGDPSEELLSMRKVKGASVIEQDCRVILTMWRPGFSPRESASDKYATVAIVKNNMGNVKTLDYSWNGLKGELKELTNGERQSLKQLRDSIAEAKAADRSNPWDL